MKILFKILAIVVTFAVVYMLPPVAYVLSHRNEPDPADSWYIVSFIAGVIAAAIVGYLLFKKPKK